MYYFSKKINNIVCVIPNPEKEFVRDFTKINKKKHVLDETTSRDIFIEISSQLNFCKLFFNDKATIFFIKGIKEGEFNSNNFKNELKVLKFFSYFFTIYIYLLMIIFIILNCRPVFLLPFCLNLYFMPLVSSFKNNYYIERFNKCFFCKN